MRHQGGRRALLATGLLLAARPVHALLPASATLLVPGPEAAPLAEWADRLAGALARGATTAVILDRQVLGGPDGVTAANRFATLAAPDGRTLLVLPGAAAQARLVGESRARFDASRWLPVCAAQGLSLVAGRRPLAAASGPLRLALPAPDHAAAAGLLGLDLLGLPATPLPGLAAGEAEAAFTQGAVDALVLHGLDVPARLASLGALPWFILDAGGQRDALLPEVAALPDLGLLAGGADLRAGFLAAAANARLVAALLLPALTQADMVALWRGAAGRWLEEEQRAGLPVGLRAATGPDLATAALAPPPEAALAYRGWLAQRLRWRAD